MIRRRIVLAYWVIALGFFTPGAAYAYIDPATTTYLIQIITAVVIMLGVSLSIFMYRFKMITAKIKYSLYGLLHIKDTSAGKRSGESCNAVIEYVYPGYAVAGAPAPPRAEDMEALGEPSDLLQIKKESDSLNTPGRPGYSARLKFSLLLALTIPLSFILIGCLDLIMHNAADIPFRIEAIVPYLLLTAGISFLVIVLVIPVFPGRVFRILISICLAVLIAGYIQGSFMNGGIGELTGEAISWGQFSFQTFTGVLMWGVVFLCVFLLQSYLKGIWLKAVIFVPVFLLVIQSVGLAAASDNFRKNGEASWWISSEEMVTIEGLHSPASGKNAIIFVLDRVDEEFIEQIAAENPGFFDVLDGFTYFDDNITYSASTFPSVAEMLTGNRYEYDQSEYSFLSFAWSNAEMMYALKERGADIRLYMDRGDTYTSTEQLKSFLSNINSGRIEFNKRVALVKLLKLSAFRYAPMPMKKEFVVYPSEFSGTLLLDDSTAFYRTNDFAFYGNITSNGLIPAAEQIGFIYYHLQGAHGPLNMDENLNWKEEEKTSDYTPQRIRQLTGCFKIVFEYFNQLKALGLYEDATIIITTDHPDFYSTELIKPARAPLFVKPAGSAGTPLTFSHAPVCPDQLPGTIMQGLFGNEGGFGPGYLDIKEGADMLRTYACVEYLYEIKGDGRDFSNWTHVKTYDRSVR